MSKSSSRSQILDMNSQPCNSRLGGPRPNTLSGCFKDSQVPWLKHSPRHLARWQFKNILMPPMWTNMYSILLNVINVIAKKHSISLLLLSLLRYPFSYNLWMWGWSGCGYPTDCQHWSGWLGGRRCPLPPSCASSRSCAQLTSWPSLSRGGQVFWAPLLEPPNRLCYNFWEIYEHLPL